MQNYTYYLLVWALTSYCLILGDFSLKFGQTRSLCFTYCLRLASQLTTWCIYVIYYLIVPGTVFCTIMYQVLSITYTSPKEINFTLFIYGLLLLEALQYRKYHEDLPIDHPLCLNCHFDGLCTQPSTAK